MSSIKYFILFFVCSISYKSNAEKNVFELIELWSVGTDLSQFNYYVTGQKQGLNFATQLQYKPFRFLTFNNVLGYNEVNDERGQGFVSLNQYNSKGAYVKLGFDVSLGIARYKPNNRFFIGYQWGYLRFSESGVFQMGNLYWSNFNLPYTRQKASYSAHEFIFGYQWIKDNWGIRIQGYAMHDKPNAKISKPNGIIDGYKSPFIPGYGYRRGGVNVILLFPIGWGND